MCLPPTIIGFKKKISRSARLRPRDLAKSLIAMALLFIVTTITFAHPLGNFTINHFARIEVSETSLNIRYIVDMAEIPTFQELQPILTSNDGSMSLVERRKYIDRIAPIYANAILLKVDGVSIPLLVEGKTIDLLPGEGKLKTLRLEFDLKGDLSAFNLQQIHKLTFEDTNHNGRIGWNEIVINPLSEISVFNSTAFGNALSDELLEFPENIALSLNERKAELSFTKGVAPVNSTPLLMRNQATIPSSQDKFIELIAVPNLTWPVAIWGLFIAAMLGGLYAMSLGYSKTIEAYLVGSRSTAQHALFLGLTVTITHTIGVFALGIVALFATQYVVSEKLFPMVGLISGLIVLIIGLSILISGFSAFYKQNPISNDHLSNHNHLELGVSSGLLPCPSAFVVLLSAISLHRIGYGLLLITAFSFGLAVVLTIVGLAFLYIKRPIYVPAKNSYLTKLLPIISAFIITCVGLIICYEALSQTGYKLSFF